MSSEERANLSKPTTYRFGEFVLEAENLLLLKNSEIVPLAPKALEVLLTLVSAGGNLITKQQIIDRVWPDTFVEEANLTHHISTLRKALGEDKDGRKFIETIPRRGYRFVALVNDQESGLGEIVITERVTSRAIETTEIETGPAENSVSVQIADNTLQRSAAGRSGQAKFAVLKPAMVLFSLAIVAVVLGLGWYLSRAGEPRITPQNITFKRLTPDVFAFDAAGTADGKSFAFVLWESNLLQTVWQKDVTTGEQSQILPAVEAKKMDYSFLRYSPDGLWLYYCQAVYDSEAQKKGGIYRIPASGGTPQLVAAQKDFFDYSISPDGKYIAYVQDFGVRVVIAKTDGNGEERTIAEKDGQKSGFTVDFGSVPAWSPDGKHLIVGGGSTDQGRVNNELIDIEIESGNMKLLATDPEITFTQLEWLTDGSGLIGLAQEGTELIHQIKFISYPDGKTTSITRDENDYIVIRLSKDNRSIFASKNMGSRNLWVAPIKDISQRKQITVGSAAKHGGLGIAVNKNGKVVYSSTQSGSWDLWEINEDGSGQKQLTTNAGRYNAFPKITSDGRYIVFVSNRSGRRQVWRMDADGRNPIQLSVADQETSSAFLDDISPDGKWVYFRSFRSGNQKFNSFKVSIEGGENIHVDLNSGIANRMFSPDGKYLFYRQTGKENQWGELILTEIANGRKQPLPENFSPTGMAWSGDSKTIYFTDYMTRLAKFDVGDTKTQTILDANPNSFSSFAVTPDNQNIFYSLGSFTNEVVLIENFRGKN